MNFLKGDFLYLMKHSSKPSVPGTSNETFPKTESTSSLQGSAEPSSPDTSISNGGETHPSKIDALKNWFQTRPIVEKFCALPTYIQSWGLTLFFMGTATTIAFCFFHALKNPTANIALTYILAVFLVARFTDGYSFGLFSSFVGVVCVNFLFTYPYFALDFTMAGYPITFVAMFSISGITSAITSNMKTQARVLAEREKMLMEAEKEKMRANLLRAISHDLRTPLTAISGSADNLLANYKKMDDALREQTFTDIYDDSMWLINLVENLLAVTRIEGGQVNLTWSIELMDEVVSEALKHINRKSKEHTIRVTSGKDFILAHIDAKLIVQVIINLVDNAIKYTPVGSVIEIHTDQKEQWVTVSVSDNGPGIPDEQKPRIFDMFYSGANKVVDSRRSLGLGLSLCKSIVTAHGGTISVSDNQPNGTAFKFTLPAEEVELHE